jgi:hypothetical protein
MQDSISLSQRLTREAIRWSWGLVLTCGLLLGYYVYQTYFTLQSRQYQLDFGRAIWIQPSDAHAPIAYFRKEIFLRALPEQGWIAVAAPDNFGLTINGHTVGTAASIKTYETGIYDITKALKQGTNVIGVSVSRTSFPGRAQLLLRGQIRESGGIVTDIFSDTSWRVTNHTGIVPPSEEWTSPGVQDQVWPMARRSPLNYRKISLRWADTNPLLVQLPRQGYWIMAENAPSQAVFSTIVQSDSSRPETWIQVASSGDLDLAVNGHIITWASTAITGGKKLPHLAMPETTPRNPTKLGKLALEASQPPKQKGSPFQPTSLDAYDISYWMKDGPNEIVAAVRSDHVPATFYADGFIRKRDGSVSQFSSNSGWQAGTDRSGVSASSKQQHAIQMGKNGLAPWGYLPMEVARPLERSGLANLLQAFLVIGFATTAVVAIWLVVSAIVSGWQDEPLLVSMSRDALLHGPIVVGLVFLWILNFDPRFPSTWSYQPAIIVSAVAALLLVRLFHLLVDVWTPAVTQAQLEGVRVQVGWDQRKSAFRNWISRGLGLPQLFEIPFRELLPYLLLVLVMSLGFGLRYHNLAYMSFDHDEMGLIAKSKGIFHLGFPYTFFVNQIRWITTYELVPYPQALSALFFGYSEWSMRLPSCLMSTACIGVMALMGRRLFDWRTGLFAAFVYACMPLNIRWGQNAFYPTQAQLMAMLTYWFFYEAILTRPFRRGYLTAATVTFCLCYLSWEGTGFMLPALLLGLLVVRWGEWWWLKEFHLYRCLFFMGAVIVAQYCSRMYAGQPYLQVGSGLSNLTGPSLFFLAPGYQPMFYVDKLLLSENHVFFTVMLVLGLPFCWYKVGFRYVVILLSTLFVLHTNFLAALSPRYCYYFQPLVILAGVAAAIMLYDRVLSLARNAGSSLLAQSAAHATGLALLLLLFLQSNESVLKEYKLSSTGDTPQMMTRMNTYRYDYRGAADYVKTHIRRGDLIFPGIPHVFYYYSGMPGDYFLNTIFSSKVFYDQLFAEPTFADKFGGLPVVRDVGELQGVVNRAGRTWVVFAPYSSFERLNSPAALDYIHEHARIVFESYRAKVLLIQGAHSQNEYAQVP